MVAFLYAFFPARFPMHLAAARPLFAWDALQDSPTLQTLRTFLEAIPDAALLASLRQARGKGRDDYPVRSAARSNTAARRGTKVGLVPAKRPATATATMA
jgi:hypothetical protein